MMVRAEESWPPVVVASVFQTGLNLMRDLLARGVRTVGIDCSLDHEGFRSSYGKSYLCPNPDTHPEEWVAYMIRLARELGARPVIIPAADIFVSAIGRHVESLREHYIFSLESIAVQSALATKEQQYALAQRYGLPIPRTAYIQSAEDIRSFAAVARFPCLIKPRHQREWEALPDGNRLRGLKLTTAENAKELLESYALTEPYRPEVVAQEIIAGRDDQKYCYLSVYGRGSRRLGWCVVKEYRCQPLAFGSASLVEPVVDAEIDAVCDGFLRGIGYVGICEIEVKRDARDGVIRLIEANPRFSVTADAAKYAGVDIGWLNYLDLIGNEPKEMTSTYFNYRHMVLRREVAAVPQYLNCRILSWRDILRTYRKPLRFFDFDMKDWGPTWSTLRFCIRSAVGSLLRTLGLRRKRVF